MIRRLIDKSYWKNRKSIVTSNLAVFIGNQLIRGVSLTDALVKASDQIENIGQKEAFCRAADSIKKGDDIAEALYINKVYLKGRDRYILSLNIPDELKGKIIKSWSESKYHGDNIICYLFIILITGVFCVASFPIFPFVIPQFYEILLGTSNPVDNDFLLRLGYDLSYSRLFILPGIILFIFVFLIIFSYGLFNKTKKIQEEADFLSFLSTLNESNRLPMLENVVNDICFPLSYRKLLKFINALKSGENLNDSLSCSGLSEYSIWLLNLNFYSNDGKVLKEGSIILNERIMLNSISSLKFIEVLIVLVQSLFFMFLAYLIFGSLSQVLLGSLSQ